VVLSGIAYAYARSGLAGFSKRGFRNRALRKNHVMVAALVVIFVFLGVCFDWYWKQDYTSHPDGVIPTTTPPRLPARIVDVTVINLDKVRHRMARLHGLVGGKVPVVRIPGVVVPAEEFPASCKGKVSIGQYGCTLAAMKALERIVSTKTASVGSSRQAWFLILEDDTVPSNDIAPPAAERQFDFGRLEAIIDRRPVGAEGINLSPNTPSWYDGFLLKLFGKPGYFGGFGTQKHAWVVSQQGAARGLKVLSELRCTAAGDDALRDDKAWGGGRFWVRTFTTQKQIWGAAGSNNLRKGRFNGFFSQLCLGSDINKGVGGHQDEEECEPVPTKPWNSYALMDYVTGRKVNHEGGHQAVMAELDKSWPGSIAAEYLHRTTEIHNYDVLCAIIKARGSATGDLPPKEAAVVHIRLGNGIDKCGDVWASGEECKYSQYVHRRPYYEEAIKHLPASKPVVLVGSSTHMPRWWHPPWHTGSEVFQQHLVDFFESHGHPVQLRIDAGTPDADITYASHATTYVYGSGGFSRIIGSCVRRFEGKAIGSPLGYDSDGKVITTTENEY